MCVYVRMCVCIDDWNRRTFCVLDVSFKVQLIGRVDKAAAHQPPSEVIQSDGVLSQLIIDSHVCVCVYVLDQMFVPGCHS